MIYDEDSIEFGELGGLNSSLKNQSKDIYSNLKYSLDTYSI